MWARRDRCAPGWATGCLLSLSWPCASFSSWASVPFPPGKVKYSDVKKILICICVRSKIYFSVLQL